MNYVHVVPRCSFSIFLAGSFPMSDNTFQSRFLVRQGGKGWMVYDRQRKGPALIGTKFAENLTEEQAHVIKQTLMGGRGAARSLRGNV